tara:strand:+ start:803 stop:1258 length:456 start_codon:yes stop_codon:yes gene_type:complete
MVQGVCVFDIDYTLTCESICSLEQVDYMKKTIDLCVSKDFGIAINTARPPQADILFNIPSDVKTQLAHVPVYSRHEDGPAVELQKLENMHAIANKFNVGVEHTILIDDLETTCDLLTSLHIPSIKVEDKNGISEKEYNVLGAVICAMSQHN